MSEQTDGELVVDAAIRCILESIGEDPDREGLLDTPRRVRKSHSELFSGYQYLLPDGTEDDAKIAELLTVFEDGACDEMVVLKGVEFASFCEHHMLPFAGIAHIAYVPDKRIIGVSKLARIVEVYSRRLQVQERLTQQVAHCLDRHLKPLGVGCVIEASHACMACRGVKKRATMMTSALTGCFKKEPETRAEFFSLVRS